MGKYDDDRKAKRKSPWDWLNNETVTARGGAYVGTIARIVDEEVRDQFEHDDDHKPVPVRRPVIYFADGRTRWIPNPTCRHALMTAMGRDSSGWLGAELAIRLTPLKRKSANKFEKTVTVVALPGQDVALNGRPAVERDVEPTWRDEDSRDDAPVEHGDLVPVGEIFAAGTGSDEDPEMRRLDAVLRGRGRGRR